MIFKIREKFMQDEGNYAEEIKKIDAITFYMFMIGVYKDHRK
jgi:hypothetical protein